MKLPKNRRAYWCLICFILALSLIHRPNPAHAQRPEPSAPPPVAGDPWTELAELRARVEQLEQEQQRKDEAEKPSADTSKIEAYEVGTDLELKAKWNHGLELSSPHKDFRVHVGGRLQFDSSWYGADANVQNNINRPYEDGVDFRRARLRVDGTMYEVIEWATEYDFVNAARLRNATDTDAEDIAVTGFTDLWVQVKELPLLGNVRVGNQKEPIGMEHLTSSRWLPFLERSYNQDAFYGGLFNGFTPGIQAFDNYADDMGLWAIGLFKPTDNVYAYNAWDGDYAVTGRITYLPWYNYEGASLLHLGVSGRQSSSIRDRVRFRTRDAIRSGLATVWPVPADTGFLLSDSKTYINAELAAVHGPWTMQAEYLANFVHDASSPGGEPAHVDPYYHGGYFQLFYFLTGEHENYNRKTAVFERVIPHENFFMVRDCNGSLGYGLGAWQVGARYNFLDLNSEGLNGGILHNGTVGLNWFLNPNLKMQFNYMATHRDAPLAGGAGDGWIHGWGIRMATDF